MHASAAAGLPLSSSAPLAPRLEDLVRGAIRRRQFSVHTEAAYWDWARRFVLFHGKRHPRELGASHVQSFLTHLARERQVAVSTQRQALNALVFLYREVLDQDLGDLSQFERPHRPARLPDVLTRDETRRVLQGLAPAWQLPAQLLYGAGLRLAECLRLRVKDVDLERKILTVREGKGRKDRVAPLPQACAVPLAEHLGRVQKLWEADRAEGLAGVFLPNAFGAKDPDGRRSLGMAVGVSFRPPVAGPARRLAAPPPRFARRLPARDPKRRGRGGHRQARLAARAAALLRHAPAGARHGHPHHPGTARTQGR